MVSVAIMTLFGCGSSVLWDSTSPRSNTGTGGTMEQVLQQGPLACIHKVKGHMKVIFSGLIH